MIFLDILRHKLENSSLSSNNVTILGIIPARGGSKRLPEKNIKLLIDKPLIAWTIEQTKKSKLLTKTIISTENEQIAEVARNYGGIVPFLRPEEFARDNSSSYELIFHALDFYEERGEKFDLVALFEPTSPLRADTDIDNAITKFIANYDKADSLISIGKIHLENPRYAKRIQDEFIIPYCQEVTDLANDEAYFPYGVIYLSKVASLRKYKSFYQPKSIYYIIKRWQNYEVDDIYDFHCIEAILKMRGDNK